jgi:hypothetical protein
MPRRQTLLTLHRRPAVSRQFSTNGPIASMNGCWRTTDGALGHGERLAAAGAAGAAQTHVPDVSEHDQAGTAEHDGPTLDALSADQSRHQQHACADRKWRQRGPAAVVTHATREQRRRAHGEGERQEPGFQHWILQQWARQWREAGNERSADAVHSARPRDADAGPVRSRSAQRRHRAMNVTTRPSAAAMRAERTRCLHMEAADPNAALPHTPDLTNVIRRPASGRDHSANGSQRRGAFARLTRLANWR